MAWQDRTMDRVDAVVVTYNRKALLVECLRALLAQTSPLAAIHVVDNASPDGTRELRADEDLPARGVSPRLEVNGGSSGGFAHGIAAAREGDGDWLWVMD